VRKPKMVMTPKMTGESVDPYQRSRVGWNMLLADSQLNVCPVTGNSIGENSTAARYKFQIMATKLIGRDHWPKENRACLNSWGVMNVRPTIYLSVL
jgi:hypothetical protein